LRDRGNEPVPFFEVRTDFIVAAAAGIAHFFFSFLLFARFAPPLPVSKGNVDAFSGNRLIDGESPTASAVKIVDVGERQGFARRL
jgi:hypothetical protein